MLIVILRAPASLVGGMGRILRKGKENCDRRGVRGWDIPAKLLEVGRYWLVEIVGVDTA